MSGVSEETLVQLLRGAAHRDEAAACRFVEMAGPLVRRIVLSHPALRSETDDLTQEIFFHIFRCADKYRGDSPVTHWMARIAKCRCLDRLRRLKTRPREVVWSDLSPAQQQWLSSEDRDEPWDCAGSGEDAGALLETLFSMLTPIDAWLLREVELRERAPVEVADEAGWSAVTLRVRLFRARHRLRQAFEKLNRHKP